MVTFSCRLEPILESDLPAIARLYSEPQVRSFLGGALSAQLAMQRAAEFIQSEQTWAVRSTSDARSLLGVVALDRHHDLEDIEVSYLFLPEHWGLGYATEAVQQVLAHAFGTMGLRRVLAETQAGNASSVRLLERLGFRQLRQVIRFGAEQRIYLAEASLLTASSNTLLGADKQQQNGDCAAFCPPFSANVKLPMTLGTVSSELQLLECELHQPKARGDSRRLTQLLHPEFREFGRSGRAYTRADILEQLPAETQVSEIQARNFHIVQLAESVYLLTYRSAHATRSGQFERHTNRSSVWRLEPVGWQMIFHQGTPAVGFDKNEF